ncbi:retrovirus-related Pol polyprotein from transposon 17.6 [Elysia marginata]|uniref:Retrovirus-related Pol polyprotein from transposon 17.6 n=1 Tax=Elysia marginata TaxID=1093978 RepID=A0AAV4HCY6_9GAST|nr:retrovirus-related Pol polyprotein from transposon 17.6 [Elysia marginata]
MAEKASKIDLNTATAEELRTLPGVGPVIADHLIEMRAEKPISAEDLKGIPHFRPSQDFLDRLRPATIGVGEENSHAQLVKNVTDMIDTRHKISEAMTGELNFLDARPKSTVPQVHIGHRIEQPSWYGTGTINETASSSWFLRPDELPYPSDKIGPSAPPFEYNYLLEFYLRHVPSLGHQSGQNVGRSLADRGEGSRQHDRIQDLVKDSPRQMLASLPKSLSYNGKDSWRVFKGKFLTVAECAVWTDRQKRLYLTLCVEGTAAEYLRVLLDKSPDMQFADLMCNMSGRFDRQQLQETAQLQFNNLYQPAGQSLVEWANTVSAAGAEPFRGLPGGYAQSQNVHRFCHGSADKEAGKLEKEPLLIRHVRLMTAGRNQSLHGQVVGPVELEIMGKRFSMPQLHVAPINDDALLGVDFLTKHAARIDLCNGLLSLGECTFSMYKRSPKHSTDTAVQVPQNMVMRSGTTTIFAVQVRTVVPQKDYILEPDRCSVLLASTLCRGGSAPIICAVNLSDADVFVREGHVIGRVSEEVEVVSYSEAPDESKISTNRIPQQLTGLFKSSSEYLNETEAQKLASVLAQYQEVFATSDFDLGTFTAVEHEMNTGDAYPIKQKIRHTPINFIGEEEAHLKKMVQAEVIEPSTSEWASTPFFDKEARWHRQVVCGLQKTEQRHKEGRISITFK